MLNRTLKNGSLLLALVAYAAFAARAEAPQMARLAEGFRCMVGQDRVEVTAFATNIVRVAVRPAGIRGERTPVLDPALIERKAEALEVDRKPSGGHLKTAEMRADFDCAKQSVHIADSAGNDLLTITGLLSGAAAERVTMQRSASDPIYGMTGTDRNVPVTSIERPNGAVVRAGRQGNGGAPFFFTRRFGVLIDSVDGEFNASGTEVSFEHGSRKDVELFVMVGPPLSVMSALADLTGHAPMPPRWTLGFLNSQYGITESELRTLVQHYRASHIPLDGFILDFDWKAWGEDDYGEWRWNSTSGAGNPAPNKFPNGASGALGRDMKTEGVHLAGILKPRILLYKPGTAVLDDAAAYAQQHGFWWSGGGEQKDYKSHQASKNLDFSIPAERAWFWKHLEPAFDSGMTAWWPDEADEGVLVDGKKGLLPSLEHFNMGRALYDGQRSHSNTRVWSINRNYYLGAARYGYAEWSGDIKTGAESMARQPIRMIGTLNLGEPHWSMDTGGFIGHPSDEEYARWMEFAAFVPIFRVHGGNNEKRQPWVYGPVAEAAATRAMRLRYALMPYLYSAEYKCFETGIGVARPLSWIFPEDAQSAQTTDEWMFGDALLVAPVLDLKSPVRHIYLPPGQWNEYSTGKKYAGSQTIELATDAKTWTDLPLFVREGSILATEEPGDDTDNMHPSEIMLDIFPGAQGATWTMYDDDGNTYDYEKGKFFRQDIRAHWSHGALSIDVTPAQGTYNSQVKTLYLRLHGVAAKPNGEWKAGSDRFGTTLERHARAGYAAHFELAGATPAER